MSVERAMTHLAKYGVADKAVTFEVSSATVELAAEAVGCEPSHIAKSLSFKVGEQAILVVAAGDAKVDNARYKAQFGTKATMLKFDEVEPMIGHGVGGVCPFGVNEGVGVYLDESLRRFPVVYPAAGSSNNMIPLTLDELEQTSGAAGWVDVCKAWREDV